MAAQGTPENPSGTLLPRPPTPWLYAYAYPSDCLLFRFIAPSLPFNVNGGVPQTTVNNSAMTWLPGGGQIPYAVSSVLDIHNNPEIVILTNQCQAQGVYNTDNSNPAFWDSLFQAAMVASLGAFLVPALSLSFPLMQMAIKTADGAIGRARAQDGNEGVTVMDHLPDWMVARVGGGSHHLGLNSSWWGGYFNMNWPDGGTYGY
jgi:hypothetical protein